MTDEIGIGFLGKVSGKNGSVKRRTVLSVGGKDRDVKMVRLDSEEGCKRQAKRWAEAFGLDAEVVESKLRTATLKTFKDIEDARKAKAEAARGVVSPPPPCASLEDVRVTYHRWLAKLDDDLLDVMFGAVMAHRMSGDPVWLFIVGAPGDGKTEVLRSLAPHDDIYMLSSLTPGSLISGYITEGDDPSLLPKLDGKVMLVKDFTAVLTMAREARTEILGTLRDAYDGEAAKAFGTGETRTYRSRFGMLAAVTPVVDKYWSVSAQLGERFLRFRLPSDHREAKARVALRNTNEEAAMRQDLSLAAMSVLGQQPEGVTVTEAREEQMISLAEFVSRARSEVSRDERGVIEYVPAPEVPTRVAKALKKLGIGISMARGVTTLDDHAYRILQRVALGTIPSMRARLLEVLWKRREVPRKTADVGEAAEIPTETAKTWLDDLRLLGIAQRGGDQHSGYTWVMRSSFQLTINDAGLWAEPSVVIPSPPDITPQTPLTGSKTGSGVGSHPLPPSLLSEDTLERQAIMELEAEAEREGDA
jgi:hypothetical protein